jgi:hypothetical protein
MISLILSYVLRMIITRKKTQNISYVRYEKEGVTIIIAGAFVHTLILSYVRYEKEGVTIIIAGTHFVHTLILSYVRYEKEGGFNKAGAFVHIINPMVPGSSRVDGGKPVMTEAEAQAQLAQLYSK